LGHNAATDGRTVYRPVASIRGLYQQFRLLIHEGAKFLVVGGVGAVVTIGGAEAMHGLGEYLAVTIATIIATVVTFVGNKYWSFRHREGNGTARETTMFFVLNGVGLLIYYGCIWVIRDILGLSGKPWYFVALVVGTALGTLFRFWSYRKWIWRLVPAAGTPAGEGMPESLSPVSAVSQPASLIDGQPAAQAQAPAPTRPTVPAGGRHPGAHRRT
jgi:putative flippase GtrA